MSNETNPLIVSRPSDSVSTSTTTNATLTPTSTTKSRPTSVTIVPSSSASVVAGRVMHTFRLCIERKEFRFTVVVLLFGLIVGLVVGLTIYSLSIPTHAAVASSNQYATRVGMNILQNGGNAVDAFVAMQAMLTFTEPMSSGIGGGLFLMYYNANENKTYALDGREEAPMNSVEGVPPSLYGGGSVAVPGTIAAIKVALNKWSSIKNLEYLWAPTIELAENGIILDSDFASKVRIYSQDLSLFDSTRKLYFKSDLVTPLSEGDLFKNVDLANTLRYLINNGLDDFYTGKLADEIIAGVATADGNMTKEDLSSYRAVFREPIEFTYKGYEMKVMNAPGSGMTIGLALNILEKTNYTKYDFNSQFRYQRIMDALSLAFADRNAYMADADWEDIPIKGLLDKGYATQRSLVMNFTRAIINFPPGRPDGSITPDLSSWTEGDHTTSFSILDKHGNFLVCTSTIQETWGSFLVLPNRGFLLNNELTDFSTTGKNRIVGGKKPRRTALPPDNTSLGGKRPRSSMSPTIVFKDGEPIFGLGSPNGEKIIAAVYQVLLNIIDWKMLPNDAVDEPRLFSNNKPEWLLENELFSNTLLINHISSIGLDPPHENNYTIGVVALVMKSHNENYQAVSDRRRTSGLALFT